MNVALYFLEKIIKLFLFKKNINLKCTVII